MVYGGGGAVSRLGAIMKTRLGEEVSFLAISLLEELLLRELMVKMMVKLPKS